MVTAEDIVQINNSEQKGLAVKLAIVTELFENGTAKIQFYGEETASEKEYSYLASYRPKIDDEVLLIPLLDTYIIAGKLLYDEVEAVQDYVTPEKLQESLTTAITDMATKHDIETYLGWDSYGTINNYSTSGTCAFNSLTAKTRFSHSGALGFFGASPANKYSISSLSTSATLSEVITKVNSIRTALNNYGLV